MSTDVQLSRTPAPITASTSASPTSPHTRSTSWNPSSLFSKQHKLNKTPPPAALTTQAERKHRRRSSSLSEGLKKLLPSQRPERGGTLRVRREGRDGKLDIEGERSGGEERSGGYSFDASCLPTLEGGQRGFENDVGGGAFDQGDGFVASTAHDPQTSSRDNRSGYTYAYDGRSQWQRGSVSRYGYNETGSASGISQGALAFRDASIGRSDCGGASGFGVHMAGHDLANFGRAHHPTSEWTAVDTGLAPARGTGCRKRVGSTSPGWNAGVRGYSTGLERGGCGSGGDGGGMQTTVRIRAETTQAREETATNGTNGGAEKTQSTRGTGLRNIFGSWGKKTKAEKLSASPEIDRLRNPLTALPILPQQDLGFQIPLIQGISDHKELTTAQKIFEGKKARREQRRSLKESGDYLGVQGANPRTGYWDVSSGSEPSQMSEETKRKLDEEAREVAERKRRYEEAELKHRAELERVQSLRDKKKKLEQKMKQRRRGKWKLSENGWSSVAEPDLSPIIQSLAGSPVVELAPGDRLFPMPTAADPTPYVDTKRIEERDYFGHRVASSPLIQDRVSQSSEGTITSSQHSIPRKPVGSPSRRQDNESSITTIHNAAISSPVRLQPNVHAAPSSPGTGHGDLDLGERKTPALSSARSPSRRLESFLENAALLELEDPQERRASVISFQSVSTKQVQIHPPSVQNQRNPSRQARVITCLNELPPITLKDPFSARIPSNYPVKESHPVWMPPTIIKTEPDSQPFFTSMFTTTTTGLGHPQPLQVQLDGQGDIVNVDLVRVQPLQHKESRIPLRTDFHPNYTRKGQQYTGHHAHPVDTVASSERHLEETKQRTTRLCQMASPEGERVEMKSTPISISMSLTPEKEKQAARNAARMAFQHLKHTLATKKAETQDGEQLSAPKTRKQKSDEKKEANREHKAVSGGRGDIGSRSRTREEAKREPSPNRKRLDVGVTKQAVADKLVVWHPEPKAEKAGKLKGNDRKAVVIDQQAGASPVVERSPTQPGAQLSVDQVVLGMLQNAWLFVEPVFNPQSDIRKRFDRQCLTWQDIGLFVAAAIFLIGMFFVLAVLARVVGIGLQAVKSFGVVVRLLIGL